MLNKNEIRRNEDVIWRINETIRKALYFVTHGALAFDTKTSFVLAYSAYVALQNGIETVDDLLTHIESKVSEQRALFVKSIGVDKLGIVFHLTGKFSVDDLRDYMRACPKDVYGKSAGLFETPESISKLALRILDAKSGESVADFGSGFGDFLTLAAGQVKDNPLYGVEINTDASEISTIRTELFSGNATIELGDMFTTPEDKKFDKIFSNYPLRQDLTRKGEEYLNLLVNRLPDVRIRRCSNWVFNCLLLDHLTDNGKAVAIMTNGDAWSQSDREIRRHLINSGLIEAVVALPSGLFSFATIATTLIVFSKGNKSIRMIDASNFSERGGISRRIDILPDSSVERIVTLLTEDGEHATSVDQKKLQKNEYAIYPPRYLNAVEIKEGVEFGSLMKRVTRGTQLMGAKLAELTSDVPTNTRYLNVKNIQDGLISEDLPYLKELDPKLDKYCIGNGNLLLSKTGGPFFKVAVAEVEAGKKLLGSDNLFIIELDENKVNPYFLKAFFDSEIGIAALASITVGNALPIISVESLKKLTVPLPSMESQNMIANRYQAKMDEIKVLRLKLQRAQNELREIFEEVD